MPLVGLGGYILTRHGHQETVPSPRIQPPPSGEFIRIKISTSYNKISGKLFLNYDGRCSYDGIKIRLDAYVKQTATELDLFKQCPIETTLPCKFMSSIFFFVRK